MSSRESREERSGVGLQRLKTVAHTPSPNLGLSSLQSGLLPLTLLGVQRFPAQFAAFGEQRHRVHQVLQRDNPDQMLFVDNRNDAEIVRGELAEGGGERLLLGGNFENAIHHSLHVAVSLSPQRFENFLLRHDAHHVAAAYHRKIVLQRVHGFFERILYRVGGRKGGKVGGHTPFPPPPLHDGSENPPRPSPLAA